MFQCYLNGNPEIHSWDDCEPEMMKIRIVSDRLQLFHLESHRQRSIKRCNALADYVIKMMLVLP